MDNIVYKFISYLGVFTLGLYASMQIRFNVPVEPYRWFITGFFTLGFIIMGNIKD